MEEFEYRVEVGKCCACNRVAPIHRHHPDYSKLEETIQLCASCHKKLRMILNGTQRKHSNPYENPLDKIKPGQTATVVGTGYIPYIDKDSHEPETMAEMIGDLGGW